MRKPIHPGETLQEDLDALDMSAIAFAGLLDVPATRITAILNGQQPITGEMALRLGHYFGTTPDFWMNLQQSHDLRLARRQHGESIDKLPRLHSPETGLTPDP